MKTKYTLAMLAILFMASSCSDYLEVPNKGNLTNDSFWQTEQHVQQGLTAAYSALASWDGSKWTFFEEVFLGMVIRTDEVSNNASSGYAGKLASFTNTADETTASNNWLTRYAGIARANQVIQNTPNVPGLTDELKKAYIGEAKFLRALNYFYLVCSFEKVPMVTVFETDFEKLIPSQAATSEIWALIESDLKEAEATVPATQAEAWTGRATKWSAKALLGKAYLFQEKWSDAAAKFKEVVEQGPYSLLPNYADNFNGVGENGVESVFEIQFSGDRNGGVDKRQPINWEITPAALDGWELFSASDWILDEMKTDLTAGNAYSDRVYESLFFDDPNSTIRRPTETDPIPYADVKGSLTFPQYFKKYNAWTDKQGDYVGTNVSLIRYADVLLMYAEALNENGNTADAIDAINTVRARANAKPLDNTFTKETLRTQIRHHERPCELSMEYGIRWMDLYRWSKGSTATESMKTTLTTHGKVFAGNFVEGKHEISPIPASEISLNKNLVQNDKW
ncbi:Starch-binding associating with outer membrane [Chryseolinea serpens]|uniref:Starch-binding associating with outer membrane n=1 Tax=Chryseolinea serpens TaxID=947013 RepID=A0A1M5VAL3_9BACT|nr:RagB/SusD family nutrient uptake outer membrane protein [Chryseolinea serpens]SHH72241.1 Starch-binding associating with outer membrane [Chryseolinea serpens]